MRKNLAAVIFSILFASMTCWAQQPQGQMLSGSLAGRPVQQNYGQAPLLFEANKGQSDSQVQFLSHGNGYSAYLTSGSMVLTLRPTEVTPAPETAVSPVVGGQGGGHFSVRQLEAAARARKSASATFAVNLLGGNANPQVVGEVPLPTKANYFIGRDPKKWRTNIPTYARVRYRNVYPGIDLVYYGNNRSMEYDFDLAADADPAQIQFEVNGADALNLDSAGNLVLTKGASELRFQTPILYQEINGIHVQVHGTYVLRDTTHVGFEITNYDSTKPLVIDPVLIYSTYLGGSGDDFSNGIAVDSTGDAYMVGITDSPDFPLASIGSYNPMQFRMFLTKLDPSGSTLLFADYFGGTSGGDEPGAVALDSSGNAYVTGDATSSDFPVVNAYQSTLSGSQDAFLVKFSADGSSIIYSTYLGGSNSQYGNSLSVDPAGEAVIAGVTQSTDFPMASAYQSFASTDQFGDWGLYGFLTKFAASGTSLVYSTYLAGSTLNTSSCSGCFPDSEILGVATDGAGNAYATGITTTTNFPVTSGAFATTYPGYYLSDVGFVSKFTSSGAIAYSTYLGGQTSSLLYAIAVDANGYAYVTGYDIANDNFPITTTNICTHPSVACSGAVIAKLDVTGATLVYSTFLGTSNNMAGQAIQVDASGDAFIVGSDVTFDLSNPIEGYAGDGDVVVAEIDATASTLLMATFLGGQAWEAASGLALDSNGAVYVTGDTQSLDFPVTQSAFQTLWGGQTDTFISKIDPTTNAPAVAMGPFALQFGSENIGSTSVSQTTILRNMGSAALTISNKTVGADFAETDDCGTTVAAASFCTFTVTFTPTTAGNLVEALTITDDATGSPHIVTLSGRGFSGPGRFIASPASVSFSSSPVGGATKAQSITVTNTGNAALSINGAQATEDFSAVSNNCGLVAPNASCTIQVSFTPTTAGTQTGTLKLTSSTGSAQAVALSGSGIDFSTSATNSSAAVTAGGSATYQLSVASVGGSFTKIVSFACNGAPAYATCAVSPQSIVPGSNASTVTVTVRTAGTVVVTQTPSEGKSRFLAALVFAPMGLFGMFVLGRSNRRKRIVTHAVLAMVMVSFLTLTGCGGSGAGRSQTALQPQVTPPGTYTLTVVGTSGRAQHSLSLTLAVR